MSQKNHIHKAVFLTSATDLEKCPGEIKFEYAFIGRSNVGKSSLINMLTNRKSLAKISSTPGKTQLINYYLIDDAWYIVDLPGYGWARVGRDQKKQWSRNVRNYLMGRKSITTLFVLIDIRLKPQEIDIEFINWAGGKDIPLTIVFTKADKLSKNKASGSIKDFLDHLKNYWEEVPPVFVTSSETRQGRDEILDYILKINKSINIGS